MIEGRETAVDTAGEVNEKSYQKDIARDLEVGEKRDIIDPVQQVPINARQDINKEYKIIKGNRRKRV